MKSQRALARGAQNNMPDDVIILNYYLYVLIFDALLLFRPLGLPSCIFFQLKLQNVLYAWDADFQLFVEFDGVHILYSLLACDCIDVMSFL